MACRGAFAARLEEKKRGRAGSASPKMKLEIILGAVSFGGGGCRELRSRSGRLRRGLVARPAAERLQTEFGELLGPDAVVLLDRQQQDGGQPLRLGEEGLEVLGGLLLDGGVGGLPVGGLLELAEHALEAGERRLQVLELLAIAVHSRAQPLQPPHPLVLCHGPSPFLSLSGPLKLRSRESAPEGQPCPVAPGAATGSRSRGGRRPEGRPSNADTMTELGRGCQ